ncbi:MAG: hypothetical protein SFU53_10800 [Terrimicrobiaceae bacterium]|nr:hypothetical protein [Terrimicrobiaceae bacterium]
MKLLFLSALTVLTAITVRAETADSLVAEALKNNPELRFYTAQIAALPKTTQSAAPKIPFPLDFPSREKFRAAVLNLDKELAQLYLDEFRFALAGTVRLKAMEYQTATETASSASDLAARTGALVKMLEERPAAGVAAVIERRILEGASLPFVRTAAEEKVKKALLRAELNGLLGRKPDAELDVQGSIVLPPKSSGDSADPLIVKIREAEIARGLAGLDAAIAIEAYGIGPWFTRDGLGASEPLSGMTLPGSTAGSNPADRRKRLIEDTRAKLDRELMVRTVALDAAREVASQIPAKLIEDLKSASDLAERQYRVGALGVNILIEAHREYLDALEARNEVITQTWRNSLDLDLLTLPANGQPSGKITVDPKP